MRLLLLDAHDLERGFRCFLCLVLTLGFPSLAGIAFDGGRPAGLGKHMFNRVRQVLTVKPDLEALGENRPLGKDVGAAGHLKPHVSGRAVERRQTGLGRRFGGGLVRVDMAVGMHRRQAGRGVVVVDRYHRQLAALLVLMLGGHGFVRVAITETELPTAEVTPGQRDRPERFTACGLSTLSRHHQQLAVGHLGRAVVLFGQPGDEIKIGLVELVDPGDFGRHRTHRLPAITRGDIGHDLRQRHTLPAPATDGLATAAHVAGLALDYDGIGRTGHLDRVYRVTAHARQGRFGITQIDLDRTATAWQLHLSVTVINAQLKLVRLHAGLVRGAQQQQPIIDLGRNVGPIGDDSKHGGHGFFPKENPH